MGNQREGYAVFLAAVVVLLSAGLLSCGMQRDSGAADNHTSKTPRLVAESEFSTLPAQEQRMLADPGWQQPYLEPQAGTKVAAPAVLDTPPAAAKSGLLPRGMQSGSKRASDGLPCVQGEMVGVAPNANPDYGCNGDSHNTSPSGNAIEDIIIANTDLTLPYHTSVACNIAPASYFNPTVGTARSGVSAVFQLSSVTPGFDSPMEPGYYCETSYAARLVPNGAPGGGCDTGSVQAYTVSDYIFQAFNLPLTATPAWR